MNNTIITPTIQTLIHQYSLSYSAKEFEADFLGLGGTTHDFLFSDQDDLGHWCFCHFTVHVDGDYFTIVDGTFKRFHISLLETKLVQWLDLLGVRI